MGATPHHRMRQIADAPGVRYHARRWPLAPRALATVAALTMALVVVGLGAPAVSAAGLANAQAHAGRAPGGNLSNPVVRRVDIASPAVVRLATIYQAHISLALCGSVVTLPTSGAGYVVGGLGSGVFISAHGDILTAGHVVNIDRDSLDQEIFQGTTSSQDIANALNAATCIQFSSPIRAIDVQNGEVQFAGIPYTTSYSAPERYAWRDTSYTGPITQAPQDAPTSLQGLFKATPIPVTPVAVSDFTQDDVAILHANLNDTPSVTLDNSNTVAVMDTLTVIGFPGNGDATNDPTNLLTPSVNTATVSAIKENDDGATLIQVGGNIEHGDSGGPALDANGAIVGVVSFGGQDTQGITAFLRSSNSALGLIQGASVSTTPGAFERKWEQAFTDYAASYPGHWRQASRELDALASAYPDFHGVAPYKAYADQAAATETLPTSSLSLVGVNALTIGAGVVILLVLALIVFALARRRARRQQSARIGVAAGATSPLSAYTTLPSGGAPEYRPVYPPNPGYPSIPLYPIYGAPAAYSVPLAVPFGPPTAPAGPSQPFAAGYPAYPSTPLPLYPPQPMAPVAPVAPTTLSAGPQASASPYPGVAATGAPAPDARPLAPTPAPTPAPTEAAPEPPTPSFAAPITAQLPTVAPETTPLPAVSVETRPMRVVAPDTAPITVVAPETKPLPAVAPDTTPLPIFPAYGPRAQAETSSVDTTAERAGRADEEQPPSQPAFAPVTPASEQASDE